MARGSAAHIDVAVQKVLGYLEGDDDEWEEEEEEALLTPEERAAMELRTEGLMELIRRIEVELATGKRPSPGALSGSA